MEELLFEVKELRKEVKDLRESAQKMDRHIDFIERIYCSVKNNLFYFIDSTRYILGSTVLKIK